MQSNAIKRRFKENFNVQMQSSFDLDPNTRFKNLLDNVNMN